MARTALTSLQDQLERIRSEAYAAGYAAAMQAIRDLTGRPAPAAAAAARHQCAAHRGDPAGRRTARAAPRRDPQVTAERQGRGDGVYLDPPRARPIGRTPHRRAERGQQDLAPPQRSRAGLSRRDL